MIAPSDPPPSQPSNVHYRADTVTASEDNCGFLIKLVYQSLNRMLDAEMAPLDLTAMQWRPLTLIERGRADTSAELARIIGVDTGAMTRTLDRLQAKGLLQRQRSEEDRRVVRLELTPAGLAKAREIPAYIAKALNAHLRGFSADEVRQLRHLLTRMLANGKA
ncbi:MarR family winged helix-turn-helix transcriptional regulator [Bordetella trematum]|uniref:MarR family winged helix-turn-helix transcriptional regulator n=1 Tax=Bordetella trematum TaxID=123899 RepID=UPI000AD22B17|nr:MarR family transcriptional regulator [Bordetella trematum]